MNRRQHRSLPCRRKRRVLYPRLPAQEPPDTMLHLLQVYIMPNDRVVESLSDGNDLAIRNDIQSRDGCPIGIMLLLSYAIRIAVERAASNEMGGDGREWRALTGEEGYSWVELQCGRCVLRP